MTMILVLGNSEQMIQISDRRLTSESAVVSEEYNKASILNCPNGRFAVGFAGLAQARRLSIGGKPEFNANDWIIEALRACAPPDFNIRNLAGRLKDFATNAFNNTECIQALPPKDRRFSIIMSGYLLDATPPALADVIITNFQDFQNFCDNPEPWDQFRTIYENEKNSPRPKNPVFIQRIGAWNAMGAADEKALRESLQAGRSAQQIISQAVGTIRKMASIPASNNSIGNHLSSIVIPRDTSKEPYFSDHPESGSDVIHGVDYISLFPSKSVSIQNFKIEAIASGLPTFLPKVGRNQQCPCRSGKKYKRCHGR